MKHDSQTNRKLRKLRVRAKISGTATRPRLSVFRSDSHIYAQLIDDVASKTLAASSDLKLTKSEESGERKAKVAAAYAVGKTLAEAAKALGIVKVVFDRNGFKYTGRITAVADGARDGGLEF
jgi:large subunit ribosomal protein L18